MDLGRVLEIVTLLKDHLNAKTFNKNQAQWSLLERSYIHSLDSWQYSPYTLQGKTVFTEGDEFKIHQLQGQKML